MIETFLNNRLLTLYIIPFILGCLVFSFQPYNFFFNQLYHNADIFLPFSTYKKKIQKAHIEKNLF